MTDLTELAQNIRECGLSFQAAREEIGKVIVGQKELIDELLIALLADGHALLEGLPGLAKTLAVKTLADVLDCAFKRVQFTPDLLPADLLGTMVYQPQQGTFQIKKGPVFTNLLLADEINRAPAKVQSALLEVMQERQVTIDGQTFPMPFPYLVLATQNPIEHEGTYTLPEAQTDRFMLKIKVNYPSREEEKAILKRMATLTEKPRAEKVITLEQLKIARDLVDCIHVDEKIAEYVLDLVMATRNNQEPLRGLILYGASPRATIALILAAKAKAFLVGRAFVTPEDIKAVAYPVLRHRLRLTYEAEAEAVTVDELIERLLNAVPVP